MTDPLVTFIVPVAPHHVDIARRALASIEAQTVKSTAITILDTEGKGAGATRNDGLSLVTSPLVVFLDADDELLPTFVERTLAAFKGDRYIYTDLWRDGGEYVQAPECAWVNENWHAVTTLLPTEWARAVGGFDTALKGGEDTEFYMRLAVNRHCGQRLGEPLFIYHTDSGRSRSNEWKASENYEQDRRRLETIYGSRPMAACCGQNVGAPNAPINQYQDGDIEVAIEWAGNQTWIGGATGRQYRGGNSNHLWMNPADVNAHPQRHLLNTLIAPLAAFPPPVTEDVAWQRFGERLAPYIAPPPRLQSAAPVLSQQDVDSVIAKWGVQDDEPPTATVRPRGKREK